MSGLLAKSPQTYLKYDTIKREGGEEMQLKYHMVTIEDLVPENHFLRKLEDALDLGVHKETTHLYS